MLSSRRRSRGFNLIEVMVTVSILALLLGLLTPSMADWVHNTQLRSLAEALQNGLQKARAEAIKRNRPVTFWLVTPQVGVPDATCSASARSGSWVVSLDSPSGKCNVAASSTITPRIVEVFGSTWSGIDVAAWAADGSTAASSVTFNGVGQPLQGSAPIGRVNLTHRQTGARLLRIEVAAGGAIRLCDRSVAASDSRACQQAVP
ncbi:MAG: GspH/FimT family pseudopilin [Ramlibacter sp.]